jgi:hypothetical protein
MIYVVCGLIGAGKSTYVRSHFDYFTECENGTTKPEQIEQTMGFYYSGKDVAHVTCFPTAEELEAFKNLDVKYLWIDTDPDQAFENVKSRGRQRDVNHLEYVMEKNTGYYSKLSRSGFAEISVFQTNERW